MSTIPASIATAGLSALLLAAALTAQTTDGTRRLARFRKCASFV